MKLLQFFRRKKLGTALILASLSSVNAFAYNPPTCKNAYTEQQELTEGAKVTAQVYQQMPVLKEDDPLTIYVQRLGAKLVQYAPGYQWPYSFHVVASPEINAFALPGGAIFINVATIQAAETEAQLAGVIAHEISHVALRHATCNLTKQRKSGLLVALGVIAGNVIGGGWGDLIAAGSNISGSLTYLRMGRDAEKQADLLGTDILYDAGYDPRGMPQFFEIIQSKYGAGGHEFLSDHPNPGNRTAYVNDEIRSLPARKNSVKSSDAFQRIKPRAATTKTLNAEEVKAGSWKNSGAYQTTMPPQERGLTENLR